MDKSATPDTLAWRWPSSFRPRALFPAQILLLLVTETACGSGSGAPVNAQIPADDSGGSTTGLAATNDRPDDDWARDVPPEGSTSRDPGGATAGETTGGDGDDGDTGERDEPPLSCGNGVVDLGEECDDGNADDSDACTTGCTAATCGDGHLRSGHEACDDGDGIDTNACTNACTLAVCGDGIVGPGEGCDDGNDVETDACLSSCEAAACGDGVVGPGEGCDDGNDSNRDGCTVECALPSCGDGVIQAGEGCDDANNDDADSCLSTCVEASCGDGAVWAGHEACDDGNADNTDACLSACVSASCGDGVTWSGIEACDDGNDDDTDSCTSNCEAASCGDGFLWVGEESCDDGNGLDGDGCESTCSLTTGALVWSETYAHPRFVSVDTNDSDDIVAFTWQDGPYRFYALVSGEGDLQWDVASTVIDGQVAPAPDGGLVIAATNYDSEAEMFNARVERVGSDGLPTWNRETYGMYSARATAAGTDSLGNVWVAGTVNDNQFGSLGDDITVWKYAPGGAPLWSETFPSPGFDWAIDIVVAVDGSSALLVGQRELDLAPVASEQLWLPRLGTDGAILEELEVEIGFNETADAFAMDASGDFVVAGRTGSGSFVDERWIRKFSTDGALLWEADTGDTRIRELAVGVYGRVHAAGYLPTFQPYARLTYYDIDGTLLWTETSAEPGTRWESVAVDSTGAVIVGGGSPTATLRKYAP